MEAVHLSRRSTLQLVMRGLGPPMLVSCHSTSCSDDFVCTKAAKFGRCRSLSGLHTLLSGLLQRS